MNLSSSIVRRFLLVLIVVAATCLNGYAQQDDDVRKALKDVKIDTVRYLDEIGLYEATSDGRVFYLTKNLRYFILGSVIDLKSRKNLTADRASELLRVDYSTLRKADAVKMGKGERSIAVFTDPDCPYCRKMHAFWEGREDVTRYIFLNPLDMHPDAVKKATFILASADTEKALFEVFSGQLDNNREKLDKKYDDKGRLKEQKAFTEKLRVDGTPSYWINGVFVPGANVPLIEKLLKKGAK